MEINVRTCYNRSNRVTGDRMNKEKINDKVVILFKHDSHSASSER